MIWAVDRRSGGSDLAQARQRRGTAGGGEAAQHELGVGVLCSVRDFHQGVQKRTASTTVDPRSGEDGATWRTAKRRGGGAPAKTARQHDAWRHEQTAPRRSLPRGESTDELDSDGTAAVAWVKNGGAAQNGGDAEA
jgi:hypothetical protein